MSCLTQGRQTYLQANTFNIFHVADLLYIYVRKNSGSHGGEYVDDGGSKHLWNVGNLPDYTAQHSRRQSSSYGKKINIKNYSYTEVIELI
jgi:hypothetical protein